MSDAPPHNPSLSYRADIDGLRAVAVLSVMACHLEVRHMTGGYVGVDVFFVISGYLISSIIFADIAAHRFSIFNFYERRIRRIFPALFGMLLAFSIVALAYFLPVELVNYSKSLLSATASVSNFFFWQHSGYFDSPTSNPLLHTWSLAVEEQFYILFPIFLILVRKFFPGKLRTAVIALFIASFLISIAVVYVDRNTAFYMPYTRAWELLMGTLLSLKFFPSLRSMWLRNLATIAGALMILFAVLMYKSSTIFPGPTALLPCVGSALIIGAGESGRSFVGSLLAWRPVVFIGLISYSLYLWHWPVIILFKMGIPSAMASMVPESFIAILFGPYSLPIQVLISLILGVLSWRFVERPFRIGHLRLSGRPLFALAAAVMLAFVALSSLTIFARGFTGRFSPETLRLASYLDSSQGQKNARQGTCFITTANHFENYDKDICLRTEPNRKNYLLIGDSHSAMLWEGLSTALPNANIMQASTSGCPPFVHTSGSSDCKKMMNFIYQDYLPSHPVDGLIMQARWTPEHLPGLAATIRWAKEHGVRLIIVGPVPEYDAPLPRLEAYAVAWNQPDLASEHRAGDSEHLDSQIESMAAQAGDPYVSLYRAICTGNTCTEFADADKKVPLMFDDNHLSPEGTTLVIHRLIDRGELSLGDRNSAN